MNYFIDFETRSSVDLPNCGAYKYAAGDDTRILMAGIARMGGEPRLWVNKELGDQVHDNGPALSLLRELAFPEEVIYAHNAPFEMAMADARWGPDIGTCKPRLEQWRCTAAMARCAGLPSSLKDLSVALGLGEEGKDSDGKRLVRKFSVPPFADPDENRRDWEAFKSYCLRDVRVEMLVHGLLKEFELVGDDLATFQLDARMNALGFPVNVAALRHAQRLVGDVKSDAEFEFDVLTGGIRMSARTQLLAWFCERGYPYRKLDAGTMELALGDPSWGDADTRRALEIKAGNSFAALAKIPAMLACEDGGRVRGTLRWHGAAPGRWSASLVQPQNFKRPEKGMHTDAAYAAIKAGCPGEALQEYGPPAEVLACCVRHFIEPLPGVQFLDCDYSSIEARLLAWAAGQEDLLEQFRNGEDPYIAMACRIFGCRKDDQMRRKLAGEATLERFVGKQVVLGAGFNMGWARYRETCKGYGVEINEALARKAIDTYRSVNGRIVTLWSLCERSFKSACDKPGVKFSIGNRLSFRLVDSVAGMPFVMLQLPSGRRIAYPWPSNSGGTLTHMKGEKKLYGALLVENAIQGMAYDIMAHGARAAEAAGFPPCLLVHDQMLTEWDGTGNPEDFFAAMRSLPEWAEGLPLEVDGKVTPYYTK